MKKLFSNSDIEEIKRLYIEEELTLSDIARLYGTSHVTIRNYILQMGISIRRTWAKKTRVCRGDCGEELPVSAFYPKDYVCKVCRPKYNRDNNYHLYKFGLTSNDYQIMLKNQDGKCAICGNEPSNRVLVVDHDHDTGEVRGLLCHSCNTGLGLFQDNKEHLLKAITYLS